MADQMMYEDKIRHIIAKKEREALNPVEAGILHAYYASRETEKTKLEKKLADLINSECRENDSNTPDYLLAEFMMACLDAFELANNKREVWYGVELVPGQNKKQEYKCTKCGLEIVVVWVSSTRKKIVPLKQVECQDCGTMTMRIKENSGSKN